MSKITISYFHYIRKIGLVLFVTMTALCTLLSPGHIAAADTVGERHTFFVDRRYDAFSRDSISATLVASGQHIYVYVEDGFLDRYRGNTSVSSAITKVISEFDTTIYPKDTTYWGSEPNPGVDNDPHVTVLFEQLTAGAGGYTDTSNLYPSSTVRTSNQREMISLAADTLTQGGASVYLAHEFEHVISANQKILLHDVAEDTWLDELRAQYSISVTGYNTPFKSSDLAGRTRVFLETPSDSLTEWKGVGADYAPVTLFGEYLAEHYGPGILQDTLHDQLTGIDSINAWLTSHHYTERFADVFGNWLVANYLNTTTGDTRFGYLDPNLASLHVAPSDVQALDYPLSRFSFTTKAWAPDWFKFYAPAGVPVGENLKVTWSAPAVSIVYVDSSGAVRNIQSGDVLSAPAGGSFTLIPFNHPGGSSAGSSEPVTTVSLTLEYTAKPAAPAVIADGSLIHRAGESELYVVEGKYKRYLSDGVVALYGHLDPHAAIELDPVRFDSYVTANYVRDVNEQKVYAVWPDGTKHWLHMSAQTFSDTGRDWNSIFIINDAELNFYKLGAEIIS